MSLTIIGILGGVFLLLLLALSMPVGFAMALTGLIGYAVVIGDFTGAAHMLMSCFNETFSKYDLSVIPLFIFMGQVVFHAGISRRLYDAAYKWMGRMPGGLAMATVWACAAFGAICGSGPATAATMASVSLPEMKRRKYDMALASGAVAAGGSLGMLIPPSVVFIVYGVMTKVSPAKLFMAGIVPGILISLLFCIYIGIACVVRPARGPAGEAHTMCEKLKSLGGIFESLLLFLLVMGGMFIGWFTPTEAAAIGAGASVVIAFARGQFSFEKLVRSLIETLRMSCMVLIVIVGASMLGRFLGITNLPAELAGGLSALKLPDLVTVALILLVFIIASLVIDALALVMLTIPILLPVVQRLTWVGSVEETLIWFGVLIVTVVQMGVITPPVGVNVYVVSSIARDVPLQRIFRGAMPFFWILILATFCLILMPQLALWLPDVMKQW